MQPTSALSPHHMDLRIGKIPGSSSRILYDIPCKVCQDHSSGKHYGIFACDGCAGFFKRSIRRSRQYVCKAKSEGSCVVDKTHRNQCRACRLKKCVEAGMNKDAVQHERGPRNSTLRRQMAYYLKEPCDTTTDIGYRPSTSPILHQPQVLDLALPKVSAGSSDMSRTDPPRHLLQPSPTTAFLCVQAFMPKLFPSLSLPVPAPSIPTEIMAEAAARLLFFNIEWAKNLPTFTRLNYKDQLLLLQESWRELFVLGAAQFMPELAQLLATHLRGSMLAQEVKAFQETLTKFKQLQVDFHEYYCLRAIVLFKTSFEQSTSTVTSSTSAPTKSSKTLCDVAQVAALQDHTQLLLNKHIATEHPGQPLRFGKLLLLLPSLKSVSNNTIEELFFRKSIGNAPIETMIRNMYQENAIRNYNSLYGCCGD